MPYTPWNLWLMRNCANCSVYPCHRYEEYYEMGKSGQWRYDIPDCDGQVRF